MFASRHQSSQSAAQAAARGTQAASALQVLEQEANLHNVFQKFDVERTGFITVENIKKVEPLGPGHQLAVVMMMCIGWLLRDALTRPIG